MASNDITMNDIISMIDKKYGYAQNSEIRRLLNSLSISESYMHLVSSKHISRYIEYYTQNNNIDYNNYLKVIQKGATKGAKYDVVEIKKVISDPDIDRRIKDLLDKKTLPGPNGPIPRCIFVQYMEELTGEEAEKILNLTGYRKHQIDLFSVPDDVLLDSKYNNDIIIDGLKQKIDELQSCLTDIQDNQNDIINELDIRGIDFFD